jgi:hypothetical protein
MGSNIELNDTLQLSEEQGFPSEILNLEKHQKAPITLDEVKDRIFSFHSKDSARVFHLDPVRVFLVQNIGGKWLFWGHAMIQSQEITKVNPGPAWKTGDWQTSGTYKIVALHDPEYQKLVTLRECPPGKSFFK